MAGGLERPQLANYVADPLKTRDVRILGLRRVFYQVAGSLDTERGPIEVTLAGGQVFVLRAYIDADTLQVDNAAWDDPFAEPLSVENRAFVKECGKLVGRHV